MPRLSRLEGHGSWLLQRPFDSWWMTSVTRRRQVNWSSYSMANCSRLSTARCSGRRTCSAPAEWNTWEARTINQLFCVTVNHSWFATLRVSQPFFSNSKRCKFNGLHSTLSSPYGVSQAFKYWNQKSALESITSRITKGSPGIDKFSIHRGNY